jgi:hypothetical protein
MRRNPEENLHQKTDVASKKRRMPKESVLLSEA